MFIGSGCPKTVNLLKISKYISLKLVNLGTPRRECFFRKNINAAPPQGTYLRTEDRRRIKPSTRCESNSQCICNVACALPLCYNCCQGYCGYYRKRKCCFKPYAEMNGPVMIIALWSGGKKVFSIILLPVHRWNSFACELLV